MSHDRGSAAMSSATPDHVRESLPGAHTCRPRDVGLVGGSGHLLVAAALRQRRLRRVCRCLPRDVVEVAFLRPSRAPLACCLIEMFCKNISYLHKKFIKLRGFTQIITYGTFATGQLLCALRLRL